MKTMLKPNINWLIIFIPISLLVNYVPALKNDIALFICSCLAMVVLSSFISTATEHLAALIGARIGGLLNATFSNLPEIIFGTVALYHGLTELVKAAMTGAIIGNLLFVLGHSMLAGGLKNGTQRFSVARASDFSTGLIIASLALFIPTVYQEVAKGAVDGLSHDETMALSLWIAIMLFLAYIGSLLYTLFAKEKQTSEEGEDELAEETEGEKPWSKKKAGIVLGVSSFLIAVISDYVAESVTVVEKTFGLTHLFMGVVVIAIIGNVAAQTTAVRMAMKNKMNLCIEVAVSASSQVALLVVPLLVFASYIFGNTFTLHFGYHEIVAVAGAVLLTTQICLDGKSNWLNGLQMLVLYTIIAVLFYFSPEMAGAK
ncbi:MAG: calcium/proton exchanger [Desulfobacteraceae bacterium]|nr:calcium/proton exchanger [Desulfobacteraceae bacterium]